MREFNYEIVANPEVYQQNRLPAHSDHICCRTEQERSLERTTLRKCLNGVWKFHYAKSYAEAPQGFEADSYSCNSWDDIRVPAHIQMEGYGAPHYTNTTYPWEGKEWIVSGEIPAEFNPTASYVTHFTVPEEWKGQRVIISLQGVESGFALWLNGSYIGYAEDSFDAAEFDLTAFLREGSNKLAVQVYQYTASSWCEDQDFFRFSGIFRDVYLYTEPSAHVRDVKISQKLVFEGDKAESAEALLQLKCSGRGSVCVKLYDACSGLLHADSRRLRKLPLLAEGQENCVSEMTELQFAFPVEKPVLWSAEQPNLYTLYFEVRDEAGLVTEVFTQRIGFRLFEMTDGIMCLNKKRIVFKGVNRHEFSSAVGRVPVYRDMLQDIITMKRNNINGLRTSHYPNCSVVYTDGCWKKGIYELCDVMGLYMIAENNMESHGSWEAYERGYVDYDYVVPGDHKEFLGMLLDRVDSLYENCKNYSSILIWSLGNESFGGSVIHELAKHFRSLDGSRLIHYEGIFHDRRYPDCSDMESQMYPSVKSIEDFLEKHTDKPFICCEYTHAMGNSCGGMHLYTDLAERNPRYQGGFIWDYIDQSIYKKDRFGKEFLAYGGDFGDRPSDYEFSGNGIAYGGKRLPSPKMQEVRYNYRNLDISFPDEEHFVVSNRNLFTDVADYDCHIRLLADGRKVEETIMPGIAAASGECRSFALPEEILTAIGEDVEAEYAVEVAFSLKKDCLWAEAGHEVAYGQLVKKKQWKPYTCPGKVTESRTSSRFGMLQLINGNNNIGVKGEHFSAIFSKVNIGLVSYVYAGRELIEWIPRPNFWRAPTNNDDGCMFAQRYSQWKTASMYVTTKGAERFEDSAPVVTPYEDHVTLTYTYYLPTTPKAGCRLTYAVWADGTIETTLAYDPVPELGDMPEFGMLFKLNADFSHMKWYGLGEEENYVDRRKGAKLGLYEKEVKDNLSAYLTPQECGNHCGVRYLQVTDRRGRGMEFAGDEMSVSVLPYTPHELENARHIYELPESHYTVVRLAKAQLGIGGDDSWGSRPLPQYQIDTTKPMEFTFCFRGI